MTPNKLMLAALLACAFAPALADDLEDDGQPMHERHMVTPGGAHVSVQVGEGMPFGGPMLRHLGKAVKNAPYSAEMVSERVQTLADGNQINTRSSSMAYRDSAGRTRQEVRDAKGELRMVTIQDPVANATYLLHPQDKSATRIDRNAAEMARAAGEAARTRIEQLRKEGKLPPAGEHFTKEREEVIVKRVERGERDAEKRADEEVRIRIEQDAGDGKGTRMSREMNVQLGPMLAGAFGDMKWSSKAATRELGSRDIEGVKADGKLRTYEIPAGEVGNRNPIVVTDETWYSPDLQFTVYTKHSDPRYGDSIFRLQGIKREEPAAALFAIPSDYTVKDPMANFKRRQEQKAK